MTAPGDLPALLSAARAARAGLAADTQTTAYRRFHGHGEGLPGVSVDRYGEVLCVRLAGPAARGDVDPAPLIEALRTEAETVVVRSGGDIEVVHGHVPEDGLVVHEHGLAFHVTPTAGANPGLYLDARPVRAWVRAHAADRRVLNLFAWTGGFGVAALAGGARSVMHVDAQKRALARTAHNHQLNAQRVDDRDLLRGDAYRALRGLAAAGRRFGAIVLDAPPTVPGKAARGVAGQDHAALVTAALPTLADDGWLLCTFSRRDVPRSTYEAVIREASDSTLVVVHRGESGVDFPEADPQRKLRFDVFARPAAGLPGLD